MDTAAPTICIVPTETTYLVQPLDVVFNAPFKAKVEKQACEHLQENFGILCTGQGQ